MIVIACNNAPDSRDMPSKDEKPHTIFLSECYRHSKTGNKEISMGVLSRGISIAFAIRSVDLFASLIPSLSVRLIATTNPRFL